MRYTPGPWNVRPNGDIMSASRGGSTVNVGSISWGSKSEDREGNSRLIANAPGLSECLDELYLLVSQPALVAAIESSPQLKTKARLILENARETLQRTTGKRIPEWPKTDPSDVRLKS